MYFDQKAFGERIQRLRMADGMTQEALAERASTERSHLAKIEKGRSSCSIELYLALGKLVSSRPEKGAAVMAAEYISANYPNQTGFSPRNLRRMRDIFRLYEGHPEMLEQAGKVGWIQNVVIMEADLDLDARYWYLLAVQRFGWSKAELTKQIAANAHLETTIREESQDNKNVSIFKKHPKAKKNILKTIFQAVDLLDRLWYNKYQQICCFRQMGIVGDAYG